MTEREEKQKTMKLPIIISITASIAIIILILYFTVDSNTIEHLTTTQIKYEFFIAAMAFNVLYWILWAVRLRVLSNAIDPKVKIGLWKSTKIIIANLFLASITPSMAGGEPVRIYLLNKEGLSVGGATAAVLTERLLDAIFLLICVPFAFFIFREHISDGAIRIGLTIAIGVFVVAVILFAYVIKFPEKAKAFLIYINDKFTRKSKKKDKGKFVEKINEEVDNFHNSMIFYLKKGRRSFIKAGFLTIIFWFSGWMIPSMILLGLGFQPFIIESFSAQALLIIIVMMPTLPGSAVVTEGGVAALYSVLIGYSLIGVFVLLFRLITYHMNLIAGAIFQYRIFKSVASFSMDTIKKQK